MPPQPDTQKYRDLLLKRKEEILASAAGATDESATVELDQSRVGRLSRMDEIQQNAMRQAMKQREAQELKAIDAALNRIDEEEYGFCRICDEPISDGRLSFNPVIEICIECAERMER